MDQDSSFRRDQRPGGARGQRRLGDLAGVNDKNQVQSLAKRAGVLKHSMKEILLDALSTFVTLAAVVSVFWFLLRALVWFLGY